MPLSFHMTPLVIVALPEPSWWNETGAQLECEQCCKFCVQVHFLIGCSASWLALFRAGRQCPGIHKWNAGGWPETYSISLLVQLVKITCGWFIITSSETWDQCCCCRLGQFEMGLVIRHTSADRELNSELLWRSPIVCLYAVNCVALCFFFFPMIRISTGWSAALSSIL